MKAWYVYDKTNPDMWMTVVFAETRNKARYLAQSTDACEYADYVDIIANRSPELDQYYCGLPEIDWHDPEMRVILVHDHGWACLDTSQECLTCQAIKWCRHFSDMQLIDIKARLHQLQKLIEEDQNANAKE